DLLFDQCVLRVRAFDRYQRRRFLHDLAFTLPGLCACDGCNQMHYIDTTDVPIIGNDGRIKPPRRRRGRRSGHGHVPVRKPPRIPELRCPGKAEFEVPGYRVTERHIQLAIKFARTRAAEDAAYLRALLAPYSTANYYEQDTYVSFIAAPEVTRGRFRLY